MTPMTMTSWSSMLLLMIIVILSLTQERGRLLTKAYCTPQGGRRNYDHFGVNEKRKAEQSPLSVEMIRKSQWTPKPNRVRRFSSRDDNQEKEEGEDDETSLQGTKDVVVKVGSKEYMEGFLSSPVQDESVAERGSGLEQALKLAGSLTIVLIALFVGFMASNGLL